MKSFRMKRFDGNEDVTKEGLVAFVILVPIVAVMLFVWLMLHS